MADWDNPIEICTGIVFGPCTLTYDRDFISQFTHIINCDTEESSTSLLGRTKCKFRHFPSYDNEKYKILDRWLPATRSFVKEALDGDGKIFIHCYMGSNRSAALAFAIALEYGCGPFDTLLTNARSITKRSILDNKGFVAQLRSHDSSLVTTENVELIIEPPLTPHKIC